MTTTGKTQTRIDKAARLVVLMQLQDNGLLDDVSYAQVGNTLGVNRSTICRDIQMLPALRRAIRKTTDALSLQTLSRKRWQRE